MNYAVASDDDQLSMFLAHSALINGLPTDAMAKISVFNRQLSKEVLSSLATPNGEENYKVYAEELAEIFSDKMADSNNIVHDKFITISSEKKNVEEWAELDLVQLFFVLYCLMNSIPGISH